MRDLMTTRSLLRLGFVLNRDGSLGAAGVIRGDMAEGARLLEALRDPLSRFVEEARREAARLSSPPREIPAGPPPVR
jgi:hypothetical protein